MTRKMKNSRLGWAGMIPKEWICNKAKFHVRINNGSDPKAEGDVPVYGSGNKSFRTCGEYKLGPAVLLGRKGSISNPRYIEGKFWNVDTAFDASVISNDLLPKYYYYLAQNFDYARYVTQTTLPSMTQTDYRNMKIPVPPVEEQQNIIAFIDKISTNIDATISLHQQIIEKLEEYRKSVITQAVTKGLDTDVKMKYSGNKYTGNIPTSWDFCKTLYILDMPVTDGPHETPTAVDNGVPFISAEAVSVGNGHIDFSHKWGDISEEYYLECCKKYIPKLHDIYMIKSGATTGKVACVETNEKFTIWSPLAVIRVNPNKMFYQYMYYFLQSDGYQRQVELGWTYGTQQNIGMRTIEKLKVCVPPLSEQKHIASYLDSVCGSIDESIIQHRHLIDKLNEYKQSLIYNAVTGKIDCRTAE